MRYPVITTSVLQSSSKFLLLSGRDFYQVSFLTKPSYSADEMLLLLVALQSLGGLLLLAIIQLSWTYFTTPLKSIPGPFFAKFTNLWRFFDTYGGRPELTHQLLHKKHGSAVRLGPNVVSISDPKYLRVIYNTRGDYLKVCLSSLFR